MVSAYSTTAFLEVHVAVVVRRRARTARAAARGRALPVNCDWVSMTIGRAVAVAPERDRFRTQVGCPRGVRGQVAQGRVRAHVAREPRHARIVDRQPVEAARQRIDRLLKGHVGIEQRRPDRVRQGIDRAVGIQHHAILEIHVAVVVRRRARTARAAARGQRTAL